MQNIKEQIIELARNTEGTSDEIIESIMTTFKNEMTDEQQVQMRKFLVENIEKMTKKGKGKLPLYETRDEIGEKGETIESIMTTFKHDLTDEQQFRDFLNENIRKITKKGKGTETRDAGTKGTATRDAGTKGAATKGTGTGDERKRFVHGSEVMIIAGSNKGIKGYQKEFFPAKYILTQEQQIKMLAQNKVKVGDIVHLQTGPGHVISVEPDYFMLGEHRVDPMQIIMCVTFKVGDVYKVGRVINELPLPMQKKSAMFDIFEYTQMDQTYTIRELTYDGNVDSTSEEAALNAFLKHLHNIRDGETYHVVSYEREIIIDRVFQNVYNKSQVQYIPKHIIVKYLKERLFDSKNVRKIYDGFFQVKGDSDKGWNLKKYIPAHVSVEASYGTFTTTMLYNGYGSYTKEVLQPKYLFYYDIELKNGNDAQVNTITKIDNTTTFNISEMTPDTQIIERDINVSEIKSYRRGFNATLPEEPEHQEPEDQEFIEEPEHDPEHDDDDEHDGEHDDDDDEHDEHDRQQENLVIEEPDYQVGFKDTTRTTQEYADLTDDQKMTKGYIDKILKLCKITNNVEYRDIMNFIEMCNTVQLEDETPFVTAAKIACILYRSNLGRFMNESDNNLTRLSKREISDTFTENEQLYNVNAFDAEYEKEEDRHKYPKQKYIYKTFARIYNEPNTSASASETSASTNTDNLTDNLTEQMQKMSLSNSCFSTFEDYITLLIENNYFNENDIQILNDQGMIESLVEQGYLNLNFNINQWKKLKGKKFKQQRDSYTIMSLMKSVCEKVNKLQM